MMNGLDVNPDLSIRLQAYIESIQQQNFMIFDLHEIQNNLISESVLLQHQAIYALRKTLAKENGLPIQEVLSLNLAPTIINIIDQSLTPWITHQGLWILTNIATGSTEEIIMLFKYGVIEILMRQLNSSELKIIEQIVYFCGNLAADCQSFRDTLISKGILSLIVSQFDKIKEKGETVQIFLLTLSNFIRQQPTPQCSILIQIASIISWSLVNHEFNDETLQYIFWSLAYLSDNNNRELLLSMRNYTARILNILIQYGNHPDLSLKIPCLRVLGNFCTGDDRETQLVIDFGFLPLLFQLLDDEADVVKKESCWALSNIAAGNAHQVSTIINNSSLMQKLFQLQKERSIEYSYHSSILFFTNLTEHGDLDDIFKISDALLQSFSDRLQQQDIQLPIGGIIDALQNLIQKNSVNQRQFIDKIKQIKLEDLLMQTTFYKTSSFLKTRINKLRVDIEMKLCLKH